MMRRMAIVCGLCFLMASPLYAQMLWPTNDGRLIDPSAADLLRGGSPNPPPGGGWGHGVPHRPGDRDRPPSRRPRVAYPFYGGNTYYLQYDTLLQQVYVLPEPGVDFSETGTETTEKADKSGSGEEMRVETREWVIDDSAPHWQVDNDTVYGGGGISSAVKSTHKTQSGGDQIFGGGKMAD